MDSEKQAYKPLAIMLPQLFRQTVKIPAQLTKKGLAHSHVNVMLMLEAYPMSTLSEIGRRMSIFRSNITPLIDGLVKHGYAERTPHKTDHRSVCVSLTAAGHDIVNELHEEIYQRMHEMAGALTIQEKKRFQYICSELGELLSHMMN